MYNIYNIHQICFMLLYWCIMIIALYKLYNMMNYERMMWYIIPDLGSSGCTQQEIIKYKEYYEYIKFDYIEIKNVLSHKFGNDVGNEILLYVPDYLTLCKINQIPDLK